MIGGRSGEVVLRMTKKLHKVLMNCAEYGKYSVKWYSIELLGSLLIEEAMPILEKISKESGDNDLRVKA